MPFILLDRNEMTILTGLVHRFFGIGLDFEIPAGLLYGGFKTLGHEMVHGFDDRGRLYDKGGLNFKFQSIFGHFPAPWQVNTVSLNLPLVLIVDEKGVVQFGRAKLTFCPKNFCF